MNQDPDAARVPPAASSDERRDAAYSPQQAKSLPQIDVTSQRLLDTLATVTRALPAIRGRGAMAQILYKRLRHDSGYWSFRMADGTTMTAARSAQMSWMPAFTGKYDRDALDLILKFLQPESYCLDIGACYGFYAVPLGLAARQRNAHVLAFEALPANERVLRHNIVANQLDTVVSTILVALGRDPAMVEMVAEQGGTGNAFVRTSGFQSAEIAASVAATVHVERLDDLPLHRWTTKRKCSLIKMDIEGFEVEALAGAEKFVAEHRPVIFGEFNSWFLERHGSSAGAPLEWAATHDYRCFELRRTRASWLGEERRLTPWPLEVRHPPAANELLMLPAEVPDLTALVEGMR